MSRRANRGLNKKTNRVTNKRIYNAPYSVKKNMVNDRVNEVVYRKISVRTTDYDRNILISTGNRRKNIAKRSRKGEGLPFVVWLLLFNVRWFFIGALIYYGAEILPEIISKSEAFVWSDLWNIIIVAGCGALFIWGLQAICIGGVSGIISIFNFLASVPRKLIDAVKGFITECGMIKRFTEVYLYYEAYRKEILLKREITEKELDKIF